MSPSAPILIVDADRTARRSLAELLRDCSYEVVEAGSEVEAITCARRDPPALVVLDPWPSVDAAMRLVQAIRRAESGDRTPILVLSSVPAGDGDLRFFARPMTRILPKPSRATALLTEIESMLGNGDGAAAAGTQWVRGVSGP